MNYWRKSITYVVFRVLNGLSNMSKLWTFKYLPYMKRLSTIKQTFIFSAELFLSIGYVKRSSRQNSDVKSGSMLTGWFKRIIGKSNARRWYSSLTSWYSPISIQQRICSVTSFWTSKIKQSIDKMKFQFDSNIKLN